MLKQISPKTISLTFGILIVCFAIAFYAVAWQEPGSAPPSDNVPAPLNVSATAQTKEGDLTINGVLKTLKDMIVNVVTIDGDGSVSSNLNSDKVDDYHVADLMAAGGNGAAVACDLICNGSCPSAPTGWTLRSSTGVSGASQTWNTTGGFSGAAAGRCTTFNIYGSIGPGTETMCCYFYTP